MKSISSVDAWFNLHKACILTLLFDENKITFVALHPDNVKHDSDDNDDERIDHRFYMKDSHHRILWNRAMEKLDCRDSIVEARSADSSNNRTLAPSDLIGMDCWLCP